VVKKIGLALVSVAVLSATSCTHEEKSAPHSAAPVATSPATEPVIEGPHWVQSQQLRGVMEQLSGLRGAIPNTEIPQDPESPQGKQANLAIEAVAALGEALSETAMKIPGAVANHKMNEADRRAFVAEAQTLRDQAIELRDAAKSRKLERMQAAMDQLNTTCFACHSRFRDLAGELEIRKASR
jgi:cytochrome c556